MVSRLSVYPLILSAVMLCICTITDLKFRRISPALCLIFLLLSCFSQDKNYLHSFGGLCLGFLPLFVAALAGNGGGGDAVLAGALGFILPFRFAGCLFLTASFAYILMLLVMIRRTGNPKTRLPYAPFLAFGWFVALMISSF